MHARASAVLPPAFQPCQPPCKHARRGLRAGNASCGAPPKITRARTSGCLACRRCRLGTLAAPLPPHLQPPAPRQPLPAGRSWEEEVGQVGQGWDEVVQVRRGWAALGVVGAEGTPQKAAAPASAPSGIVLRGHWKAVISRLGLVSNSMFAAPAGHDNPSHQPDMTTPSASMTRRPLPAQPSPAQRVPPHPLLACASAAARFRSTMRSLAESTIASFTLQPCGKMSASRHSRSHSLSHSQLLHPNLTHAYHKRARFTTHTDAEPSQQAAQLEPQPLLALTTPRLNQPQATRSSLEGIPHNLSSFG